MSKINFHPRKLVGAAGQLNEIRTKTIYGRIASILGMLVEIEGVNEYLSVGDRVLVLNRDGEKIPSEIVGFKNNNALAMAFYNLDGVGLGAKVEITGAVPYVLPNNKWLGRVINAFGEPLDDLGPISQGDAPMKLRTTAPPAHQRARVAGKMDLGIKAINTFLTCCKGQRMGIFSGSGVGKSTLMSMLARYAKTDVNVIGLVGERGREVTEFIEDDLGPEGLARSVIVVATGDESPLMRRQAAYTTMAVAEYFRDQGNDVLCMIDSITRFAMAQREIGLSAGEPPASKGYTPTVFSELPRLLERAGPGYKDKGGSITGLFTVLVEGDDTNEPISDAVRGILDGHIVLDRKIAERGRYPSIDVLRSISRTLPDCNNDHQNEIVDRGRQLLAAYDNMAEMIRLGAYKQGSDPVTDEAIGYHTPLEDFLSQKIEESVTLEEGYARLESIFGMAPDAPQQPNEDDGQDIDVSGTDQADPAA